MSNPRDSVLLRKDPATGRHVPIDRIGKPDIPGPAPVPDPALSPAQIEAKSAALWRHRLHCNARELEGQVYVRERIFSPVPAASAVRRAKTPQREHREHVDGYFFNRPRHAAEND